MYHSWFCHWSDLRKVYCSKQYSLSSFKLFLVSVTLVYINSFLTLFFSFSFKIILSDKISFPFGNLTNKNRKYYTLRNQINIKCTHVITSLILDYLSFRIYWINRFLLFFDGHRLDYTHFEHNIELKEREILLH